MTLVQGELKLVTDTPDEVSQVWIQAPKERLHGTGMITDGRASEQVKNGVVSFNALPGVAVMVLLVNGIPSLTKKLLVPDKANATLRECIEAVGLADDGTLSELEELALEVARVAAQIASADRLEAWASETASAAAQAQLSNVEAGLASNHATAAASNARKSESNAKQSEINSKQSEIDAQSAAAQASTAASNVRGELQDIADDAASSAEKAGISQAEAFEHEVNSLAAAERAEFAAEETIQQVEGDFATRNYADAKDWVKGNVPVGSDLNDLTTPGIHGVTTYNHANGLVNRPPMGDAIRASSVEVKSHSNGSVSQTWIPWPLVGQRQLIVERLRDSVGAWTDWVPAADYAQYLSVHEDIFAKPAGRWMAASYAVASQIVNRPPSDYGAWGPAIVDVDEGPSGQKMITWSTMNGSSQVSSIWRTQQDNGKSWAPWRRIDGMTQEVVNRDERRVRDIQRSEFNRYRGLLRVMLDASQDPAPLWGYTGPTGDMLTYPTHEGSGHATHPSVLYFPGGWNGWEYWMAMTPYPDSDEGYEDPDIIVSHDGVAWQVPDGLTNPLDDQPGRPGPHNSDPHLVIHPDGRMILTWRMVDRPNGGRNRIFWRTSTDGVTWTPKREIWTAKDPGTQETSFLSQSMVWTGTAWRIYGVSGDFSPLRIRYYETTDVDPTPSSWGTPIDCHVDPDLPQDREWWHLDVQRYQGEYWAVGNDHGRARGFGDGTLYLLRSDDGQAWETSHTPLIATGGPDRDDLYKASMVLSGTGAGMGIDLFYSSYSSLADEWNIWRSACRLAGR